MTTAQESQPTRSSPDKRQNGRAPQPRRQRRFSLRGFTSLLLSVAFLVMCVSGIMLFLTPRGRTANWTDWTLLGLDKHQWESIHVNNSIVFIAVAILHLVLNWSVFMRYIKKKATTGLNMKKEMALTTVVATVCIVGPIWNLPPFSTLMSLNEEIKNYWDENAQQPPVPHAEEFTLAKLASTIGLSVAQVSTALKDAGYDVEDADQTIGEIGKQKGVAPSVVFDAIRDRHPSTRGWGRIGGRVGEGHGQSPGGSGRGGDRAARVGQSVVEERPGRGRGQGGSGEGASNIHELTLSSIASAVGLTVEEVLTALIDAGFDPKNGETTVGQLCDQQSKSPDFVINAIRDRCPDTRGWGRITGQRGGGRR